MEFSRQEYWNVLPSPPSGDLPNSGTEPASPALAGEFFTTEPPGKSSMLCTHPSCSIFQDTVSSFFLIYSLFFLKPMSIESVMLSNHLILCCPLLLLPSVFPSIRVFSNESALRIRWPKYWSFSFSISPSNEHPGLISFRMDWLDLRTVQGTLKSLLQHHSSKASILWHSAFFISLIKNLRSP